MRFFHWLKSLVFKPKPLPDVPILPPSFFRQSFPSAQDVEEKIREELKKRP